MSDNRPRCAKHGDVGTTVALGHVSRCQADDIVVEVLAEREAQFARYGDNSDLLDGTGPAVQWLYGAGSANIDWLTAEDIERQLRLMYEYYEQREGAPTWRHLVLEEVAEVFAESDPARLRAELIQVAALAVSWIAKIDARS